jgi:hypothetical protein
MTTVLGWVDAQETGAVLTILRAAQASAARAQLKAISELDPRNRGTTYMSAGSVLGAYRYPEVQQLVGDDFSPSRFVASAADTLFLVAEDRHQQLVAPLLVALLAVVLHEVTAAGRTRSSPTRRPSSTSARSRMTRHGITSSHSSATRTTNVADAPAPAPPRCSSSRETALYSSPAPGCLPS